jgi:starch phosphorylase
VARVLDAFKDGRFCPHAPHRHEWVYHRLLDPSEPYLHLADLESYLETHDASATLYRTPATWDAKAVLNVARVGKFSSDRTIQEYARAIWNLRPAR